MGTTLEVIGLKKYFNVANESLNISVDILTLSASKKAICFFS